MAPLIAVADLCPAAAAGHTPLWATIVLSLCFGTLIGGGVFWFFREIARINRDHASRMAALRARDNDDPARLT